jgi:hypothetical protein
MPIPMTAQVLGGEFDGDLLLLQVRSMPQTWPSYPTVYLSSMDLPKPLLILFIFSDSMTSQAKKFQMCTKYYFILCNLQLPFPISYL